MHELFLYLRQGLRQLRRAPGFTLTVLLTLALGIGATTAIFTLVYDVMLKPLPLPHPGQLVVMEEQVAEFRDIYPTLPVNANHFLNWEQHTHSFQAMAAIEQDTIPLGTEGHPLQIKIVRATPGIFSVLGVQPQLGRQFTAQEGTEGKDRVAVLTNDLWRAQFHADPAILGKPITLDGFPYTVIGVMPPSLHLPLTNDLAKNSDREQPVQILVPKAFTQEQLSEPMGDFNYFALSRLRPGVTVQQANAEINALEAAISAALPKDATATLSAALTPFQDALIGTSRTPLLILLAAVFGLLIVGCVNITNLLLSHSVGQRSQLAVTVALGARKSQVLLWAMREPLLLSGLGAGLGVLLAAALMPVMQRYLPPALDFRGPLHLDWVGLGCALALAVGATLLAGAAPAWAGMQTQPVEALRSAARQSSESRGSKRFRRTLVTVEVAISVILVLMTGLLTTSVYRLLRTSRGFDTGRVLAAKLDLPRKSYVDNASRGAFFAAMLDRLRRLPAVESAAVVSVPPLGGDSWIDMIRVDGDSRPFMQLPTEHFRWVSPDYFETIHQPLVSGRFFSPGDQDKRYAVVTERTARTLWPGKDPVGRPFHRGDGQPPITIIGIVKDARTISLAQADPMMVYMPYWYRNDNTSGLLVRTKQDPSSVTNAVRKAIWSVDPGVSVPVIRTLNGVAEASVANRRFEMDLLVLFAATALLLAGLGVYGVVAYSVVQREREIGLRLALGAQAANIYSLVLREGMTPVLLGTLAGIVVAAGFAHLLSSVVFAVSPSNPVIVAGAAAVLLMVGMTACLLPAHRAASTDPAQTLKAE